MSDQDIPPHALLGVYPAGRVEEVVRALAQVGVREQEIRRGDEGDEVRALTAEMREEATESVVVPPVGVAYSKEAAKATSVVGPVLVALGALLAAPFAVLLPEDIALWGRLLIVVVCGAAVGATVALIVVPAMAVKNQDVPSAAQRGEVLRVGRWAPEVEQVMAASRPLRLDRLGADGQPIGPVATEEEDRPGGIVEELGRNFAREHRVDPQHRSR